MNVRMIVPPIVVEPMVVVAPMVVPVVVNIDVIILPPIVPLVPIVDVVGPVMRPITVARTPLRSAAALARPAWAGVISGSERPIIVAWTEWSIVGAGP
jgi:hypothetical protein